VAFIYFDWKVSLRGLIVASTSIRQKFGSYQTTDDLFLEIKRKSYCNREIDKGNYPYAKSRF